ncbi:hypothetical protein ACF07V_09275 [Streptomyces sp. NPDC015661]|uniref:hypothetical protein n=1 Tax=Streptomyces sp. NPDC015661 TaxID=3364961 RepID=UPI0036FDE50B
METVLSARGTSARFDGSRLKVVRAGTTWTVPVRAIASVEETTGGAVRVALAGDPSGARHGLGGSVALSGPNARAAQAFADHLRGALGRVETVEDGHALVTVVRPAAATPGTGEAGSRAVLTGFLLCLYAGALWGIGAAGPRSAPVAAVSLTVGGALGALGAVGLWRVARRFRSMWILRTRGIGVVADVKGFVKIWDKGGHSWVFPRLSYTTVEGQSFTAVPSATSAGWKVSTETKAEVLYDPAAPRRVGVPPTAGFVVRSTVLGLSSLFPAIVGVYAVLENTSVLAS